MNVRRATSVVLSLGVVLIAAWLAMPAAFGGRTSYVATHGISMEPRFHTGDLAVVRASDRYDVGDVVAYRSALLKTVVMHRIVKVDHGHFTFKGDNNSFLDRETPTRDRLIGRLALRVPQGGRWLQRLTSPAVLGGLAFLVLTAGSAAVRSPPSRRRNRMSRHARRRTTTAAMTWTPATAVAAGAALLAVAMAAVGWAGPTLRDAVTHSQVKQTVSFSYAAAVGHTPAYDGPEARSPDPVFRSLAQDVEVAFDYRGAPATVSVSAQLAAASGWHSAVQLAGPTSFLGDRYAGRVRLNLRALQHRIDAAAAVTGVPAEQVTVAVVPSFVTAQGAPFQPRLPLRLSPSQLSLDGAPSVLSASRSNDVAAMSRAPRTVGVGGHTISAAKARAAAVLVGLLAVLVLGCAVVLVRFGVAAGGSALARHRSLIVDVEPVTLPVGRPLVDVSSLATLARVAERYGLLITRSSRAGVDTFLVQDEASTFRYRQGDGGASPVQGSARELSERSAMARATLA